MKIIYLLLQWGELFQGFYTLKIERWYSLYVADQDTPRYSLRSVKEKCVSLAALYAIDDLVKTRVFPPVE